MTEGLLAKDQVGRSIPRLESDAKVTGTVEYIHNLELPGMLHGKIVRSIRPHARLASIDAERALEIPGVRRVVTADDVRTVTVVDYVGPAFHDQPVLALGKVRYVGEPVACVLADTPRAAAAGAELVEIEYEDLPAVYDEIEACAEDAPVVHEEINASSTFPDLRTLSNQSQTNVALEYRLKRGDVEAALASCDHVFEHTYRTVPTHHAPLEPMVSVGELGDRDSIVVHSATQNPSHIRVELARLFGVAENQVRVRTAYLGGGFGLKLYPKLEPLVAVCARLMRRPVKIALTMDEQFVTLTRHGTTIRLKTGVNSDGQIVARSCDVTWNTGAYADIGPRVAQKTGFTSAGPYDIDNVEIDSKCVYTNLPPAGAFRGFGVPQVAFAYESHTDMIARELGLDPLAFRERNLLRNDRPHATGSTMHGIATDEVLEELRRSLDWDEPIVQPGGNLRRGRGVAIGMKAVLTPSTSVATVTLAGDGSCTIACGTVDMGQASDTAHAQIAGEVLGLRAEDIMVIRPDTTTTPYDLGTLGSRSLYHMGNAIVEAAGEVRDQLLAHTSAHLGIDQEDLELRDGHVVSTSGERIAFEDVMVAHFGMQAGNLIGRGECTPAYEKPDPVTGQSSNIAAFWMVGGAGVQVVIDEETGRLEVERLVVVGDVGRAINPAVVQSQLTGAGIMQLGMARTEEMVFDAGQLTNTGLAYYKIPGILDIPSHLESVVIEIPLDGKAPFGAKGVGETGSFAVAPAIANAIADAVGVRLQELPLTDERIWEALNGHAAAGG